MIPNQNIRKTILDIVHNSSAAHIGTALSAVEIVSAVFKSVDIEKIKERDAARDRIILSKGHGAAVLYATMYHYGLLTDAEVNSYFKNDSLLEGHASHFVPYVEHSTGALGHGLSVAVGMAVGLRAKKLNARVFVIVGDGELHEGSNWEAFMQAGHLKAGNLCVLIDRNGLSQMGKVEKCCTLEPLIAKLEAFNFDVFQVDGHNEGEIFEKIQLTKNSFKPIAIICNTIKGKGVTFMEDNNLWHYRCPQGDDYEKAKKELEMQAL